MRILVKLLSAGGALIILYVVLGGLLADDEAAHHDAADVETTHVSNPDRSDQPTPGSKPARLAASDHGSTVRKESPQAVPAGTSRDAGENSAAEKVRAPERVFQQAMELLAKGKRAQARRLVSMPLNPKSKWWEKVQVIRIHLVASDTPIGESVEELLTYFARAAALRLAAPPEWDWHQPRSGSLLSGPLRTHEATTTRDRHSSFLKRYRYIASRAEGLMGVEWTGRRLVERLAKQLEKRVDRATSHDVRYRGSAVIEFLRINNLLGVMGGRERWSEIEARMKAFEEPFRSSSDARVQTLVTYLRTARLSLRDS